MRAWRAVLDPADVKGRGFEVDLLPAKVHDFPQAVPVGHERHKGITVAVAVPVPALFSKVPLHTPIYIGD